MTDFFHFIAATTLSDLLLHLSFLCTVLGSNSLVVPLVRLLPPQTTGNEVQKGWFVQVLLLLVGAAINTCFQLIVPDEIEDPNPPQRQQSRSPSRQQSLPANTNSPGDKQFSFLDWIVLFTITLLTALAFSLGFPRFFSFSCFLGGAVVLNTLMLLFVLNTTPDNVSRFLKYFAPNLGELAVMLAAVQASEEFLGCFPPLLAVQKFWAVLMIIMFILLKLAHLFISRFFVLQLAKPARTMLSPAAVVLVAFMSLVLTFCLQDLKMSTILPPGFDF